MAKVFRVGVRLTNAADAPQPPDLVKTLQANVPPAPQPRERTLLEKTTDELHALEQECSVPRGDHSPVVLTAKTGVPAPPDLFAAVVAARRS